jgi:ATP/maltotriose-dependent transcriptional regulator MalT
MGLTSWDVAQRPDRGAFSWLIVYRMDRGGTWREWQRFLLAACERVTDGVGVSSGRAGQGHTAATCGLEEPLSRREREVLQLLAAGLANEEMAGRLYVTAGTIKTNLKSI